MNHNQPDAPDRDYAALAQQHATDQTKRLAALRDNLRRDFPVHSVLLAHTHQLHGRSGRYRWALKARRTLCVMLPESASVSSFDIPCLLTRAADAAEALGPSPEPSDHRLEAVGHEQRRRQRVRTD